MAKHIYNPSEEAKTYEGNEVPATGYFQIPAERLVQFQACAALIADLALGKVQMSANGTSPLTGSGSAHVDFLKDVDLTPRDPANRPIYRAAATINGWAYQLHGVEFKSSKLGSVYSKKPDGSDYGFTTLKLYDAEGAEITATENEGQAVKTVVDWEPNHDYEIIGGIFKQKAVPASDVRLWVIGVPDVPAVAGGSKVFVSSVNLRYLGVEEGIRADGRASKFLPYNASFHTNKLRIQLTHAAGVEHELHFLFEVFKP